jgi:pimeloyl-ACP methyl ester carboxylesterase
MDKASRGRTALHKYFLCLFGLILSLPLLALIVPAFALPITLSGIGYLFGCSIAITGLILAPRVSKYYFATIIGGLVVVLVAAARVFSISNNPNQSLSIISLPHGKETSWLNALVDEQDSLIFGEALFHFIGGDSNSEHENITSALYTDYSEMRAAQGIVPSPFLSTYLYLQQPDRFDTVIVEPEVDHLPKFGVIFLHGYMGNVTVQCWEIAQAVKKLGGVTVCPSTEWTGQWWQPRGQSILRAAFEYMRARGIQKIYLGGFSNGGFGISRMASQLGEEKDLRGLFFIDGITDGMRIKQSGLPVLIIQGSQDERMPAAEARRIAEIIGNSALYIELNSDHFVIMKQPVLVQNTLAAWLAGH